MRGVAALLLEHIRAQVVDDLCASQAWRFHACGERVAAGDLGQPSAKGVALDGALDCQPVAVGRVEHVLVLGGFGGSLYLTKDVVGGEVQQPDHGGPNAGEELRRWVLGEELRAGVRAVDVDR